jgi:hypothetical protein
MGPGTPLVSGCFPAQRQRACMAWLRGHLGRKQRQDARAAANVQHNFALEQVLVL